jgi:hypothetical protein
MKVESKSNIPSFIHSITDSILHFFAVKKSPDYAGVVLHLGLWAPQPLDGLA